MPRYDYDCAACGRRFEVVQGLFADGPTACPLCGSGPVKKAFSAPAIHFKGSGWAKKERRATVGSSASRNANADNASSGSDGGSSGSDGGSSGSDSGSSGTDGSSSGADRGSSGSDSGSSDDARKPSKTGKDMSAPGSTKGRTPPKDPSPASRSASEPAAD